MACKLCNNESKLMNSHIIPEFIYKPLYDEKHRFHVLSTYKKVGKLKEQKGIRENMLCSECEQHISRYESYARKVLFGGVPIVVQNDGPGIIVSEIDYKLFKLFILFYGRRPPLFLTKLNILNNHSSGILCVSNPNF